MTFVERADHGNERVRSPRRRASSGKKSSRARPPESSFCPSVAFSPDPEQRFLYVGGAPGVDILKQRTVAKLGAAAARRARAQDHPLGRNFGGEFLRPLQYLL